MTPDEHRRVAAELFNLVWELMEKPDRTTAETDTMIHAAHASRYHWGEAGTAVNLVRGEWQVSRAYAVAGRAEPALYHARCCLALCEAHGIGDFDLAYAYEALARAHALAGNRADAERFRQLAAAAGEEIVEDDDRQTFHSDLATLRAQS